MVRFVIKMTDEDEDDDGTHDQEHDDSDWLLMVGDLWRW